MRILRLRGSIWMRSFNLGPRSRHVRPGGGVQSSDLTYHWGEIRLGADLWPVAGSDLTAGGVRPVGADPWTPAAVADAVSGE